MSEEPNSIPKHSHDRMYLVSHGGDVDRPKYESCHHCSYIYVPELADLQSEINSLRQLKTIAQEGWTKALKENRELVGALENIADHQGLVAGNAKELSTTYCIATRALKQHREERKGE